ncbi:MAG: bifunctional phosphoribosylaminoimidazolecarboxamide formyltransferase/IMP cyclohydrolase [Acidimicrobiia bacterium]|nr:bifunctional phosphoribosylaminoimidazolecarboxamide formyltransferase/IMP cyclohydrolase [Acidimicrobiia bacterium]
MTRLRIERALISVYDKSGLVEFAQGLHAAGIEIISSGGTAKLLADQGVDVLPVEEVTGAAEMLDGRVKTLHPSIHGGILADMGNRSHVEQLAGREIEPIHLVVANLYPFEETVARGGATETEVIEQIDIGGPTMVRAAAKNHAWTGIVVDPSQYDEVLEAISEGGLDEELRRRLAGEAFARTAAYDAAIVHWFQREEELPDNLVIALEKVHDLRYGENPHQAGASYRETGAASWWAEALQTQGKAMSFNNLVDADAAWRLATDLEETAVAIIKHTNPCGVAVGAALIDAFEGAWECDPMSAFGSVVAINRELDRETAVAIAERFVEVVIVPGLEADAHDVLDAKPNLRVLVAPLPAADGLDIRRIDGGFVGQAMDTVILDDWEVVSNRQPTDEEVEELELAWKVVAHAKSNSIVIANDGAAVGVGAGDQSRVGASEKAVKQAGDRAEGGVAASDAFFPFRDGLDALADAGVTAVVEPGGSRRDDEVIEAANEHDLALVFTGRRHFRH